MLSRTTLVVALVALVASEATATPYSPIPRARALVAERRFDAAVTALQEYLSEYPDDAEALRQLGEVYLAAGRWNDAIDTEEKALAMRPNNVNFILSLAAAYREKARRSGLFGAIKAAKQWKVQLERAVEIDPRNVEARRWLVAFLVKAPGFGGGDKDRALELARETITFNEFEGRISTGFVLRIREEYPASFAQYDTLLMNYADSARVYSGFGYTLIAAGRAEQARAQFEEWLRLAPDQADPWTGMGDCLRAENDIKGAAAAYLRALAIDPYYSDARFPLAEILEEGRQYEEAREEYRAVYEMTPEYVLAGKAKKRAYELKKKRH